MRIIKIIVFWAVSTLLLSGCQPAPSPPLSQNDSSTIALESTISSSVLHETQGETEKDSVAIQKTTIIPEYNSHVVEEIIGEAITISIDADIISPQCDTLHYYTCQTVSANETHAERLINTLWQSNEISTEFKEANNQYMVTLAEKEDTFSVRTKFYQIILSGHGANLCPYGSNAYDNYCQVLSSHTNDKAAKICVDLFSEVCGLDSEVLSVISYGKTIGEKYCKILTAPVIDGLPVINSHTMNKFDFCDLGIYNAKLYCYEFSKGELIEKIISLDDAIDQLQLSTDKILRFAHPEMYEIMDYITDDSGVLTRIKVNEIRLGYILVNGDTVCPAWIFAPGKELTDYSISFAVNAINGDVVLI